jgi:hypothetical protein
LAVRSYEKYHNAKTNHFLNFYKIILYDEKVFLPNNYIIVGDTVATLSHTFTMPVTNHLWEILSTCNDPVIGGSYQYQMTFTDLLLNGYTPCYVTVGLTSNIPTVFFESLENNTVDYYVIKRYGIAIDTVIYSTGILSWTDSTLQLNCQHLLRFQNL